MAEALSIQELELWQHLLGLEGLRVRGARLTARGVVVDVCPRQRKPRCGMCLRPAPGYDSEPEREWRHLSLGPFIFWLRYPPRRVTCCEHGVRVEHVPWAAHGSQVTHPLEELVVCHARRMTRSDLCQWLGIDSSTVDTLLQRANEERVSRGVI